MRFFVEQSDLIGEIADFPIQIVQRMVDCQVEQGNTANVKVFQKNKSANCILSGFDWHKTNGGNYFWERVIYQNDFEFFFEKYKWIPTVGEKVIGFEHGILSNKVIGIFKNYSELNGCYVLMDEKEAFWNCKSIERIKSPLETENKQDDIKVVSCDIKRDESKLIYDINISLNKPIYDKEIRIKIDNKVEQ